jgi:hypothetical protein
MLKLTLSKTLKTQILWDTSSEEDAEEEVLVGDTTTDSLITDLDLTVMDLMVLLICLQFSENSWTRSVDNKRKLLIMRTIQQIFLSKYVPNSASTRDNNRESVKSARSLLKTLKTPRMKTSHAEASNGRNLETREVRLCLFPKMSSFLNKGSL